MTKFKRKPISKNEFFETMDSINGDSDDKYLKKKSGRPSLPENIKTKKTSVSIRRSDEEIIDNIINKLVASGCNKPFPSSSEIHRMGIISLSNLSLNELLNYYSKSKI